MSLRYSLGMGFRPIVLSIAGYDPSSGAGVTADVKTAAAMGCYAATCISALTVQTTQGVFAVEPVGPDLVRHTLFRLADDLEFDAIRIGMLGSGEVAGVVAEFLRRVKLPRVVLDPVFRSSSGAELVDSGGLATIRNEILPLCAVITPNLEEAAELADLGASGVSCADSWESALPRVRILATRLHQRGCRGIVITGGHLREANDFLSVWNLGQSTEQVFRGAHLESKATHGTGCAFAMALACGLAYGRNLPESVQRAKDFVRTAITASYPVGKGIGPMNHLFRLQSED
jgi:hydroxymethylpyrimidine/phosphomethylpyrimidine kinase